MTELWLVRHGSTDALTGGYLAGRRAGLALDARGREEVAALARRLARVSFAAIYSSPLERTRETARAIAETRALPVRELPALIELDFGEWTGRKLSELDGDARWRRFNAQRSTTRIPGGETMLEVQARAVDGLLALVASHAGERVLIASHGDVIRALVCYAFGMPLDFFARIEIAPASITCLELGEHAPRVTRLNDCAHLE